MEVMKNNSEAKYTIVVRCCFASIYDVFKYLHGGWQFVGHMIACHIEEITHHGSLDCLVQR
jgi:ribosome-associated toxin RatA of RatAB toxin-antitoxin module